MLLLFFKRAWLVVADVIEATLRHNPIDLLSRVAQLERSGLDTENVIEVVITELSYFLFEPVEESVGLLGEGPAWVFLFSALIISISSCSLRFLLTAHHNAVSLSFDFPVGLSLWELICVRLRATECRHHLLYSNTITTVD